MRECVVCRQEFPTDKFYGCRKTCKVCYKHQVINGRADKMAIYPSSILFTEGAQVVVPELTEKSLIYHRTDPNIGRQDDDDRQYFPFCFYFSHRESGLITDVSLAGRAELIRLPGVEQIHEREKYVRMSDGGRWTRTPAWNFVRVAKGEPKPDQKIIDELVIGVDDVDMKYFVISRLEYGYTLKHYDEFKLRDSTYTIKSAEELMRELDNNSYIRIGRNGFAFDSEFGAPVVPWGADD